MNPTIRLFQPSDRASWDDYVLNHPQGTLYHLSGWREVISNAYGHKCYYLTASRDEEGRVRISTLSDESTGYGKERGIKPLGALPLVHLKHFLFGNSLVSIPYFDLGGVLADDQDAEKALLLESLRIGSDVKVDKLELRHVEPLASLQEISQTSDGAFSLSSVSHELSATSYFAQTFSHKVRMLLELPGSPESLMKSFKAKLRSQIRKPMKEGLTAKIGSGELLDDFYAVFSENMRDLGSPVHSKKLIENVLKEFPDQARIIAVYKDAQPLACSLVVGFRETLENPWASALRGYSALSPNMLLYWTMIEYACNHRYKFFDFGRSSPNEGTYKFKEQWGARPTPLNWHYIALDGRALPSDASPERARFGRAIQYWQKLPVPVTKILGPRIRKHIGL